jgi:hypothetical protein
MRAVVTSLALWCSLVLAGTALRGEDFRIDTEVFIGDDKDPVVETLTIFSRGRIYDFLLTKPEEITLFEPGRGILTMLDVKRQVKATIDTQELLDATLSLQTAALQSSNSTFRAAAKPEFALKAEAFEENGHNYNRLVFNGSPIAYTVVGEKPRHPEAVQEFKYFADWYARLNAVRPDAGNLPPGARLEVNKAIAEKGLLPIRVERVMFGTLGGKKSEVRSEHLVNWTLSNDDRARIDQTGNYLANENFKLVTFDEYCRKGSPAR